MSYSYEVASSYERKEPQYTLDAASDPIVEKEIDGLKQKDLRMKIHIRLFKVVVRVLTFALSVFATYTQAAALHKFLTTKTINRNGRDPWAKGTQLWPTYLLLTTSALTAIVSLITVLAYLKGIKQANKRATKLGTPVSVIEICAHSAVWISTTIGYRIGKTGQDLWGWSCSPKAQAIQEVFPEVNFDFFCNIQGGSWIASIAQVFLTIVTGVVWGLTWRRHRQNKKIRIRQSLLIPQGYCSQQQ
ncbi:MAG: hypothetical protein MMC23_008220 [Stictis urceolatum]|nr:hypothetical protein [Stictis urceolata]